MLSDVTLSPDDCTHTHTQLDHSTEDIDNVETHTHTQPDHSTEDIDNVE